MSIVARGRAPEPCRENGRSRNQDISHPQRFLAWPRYPVSRSAWPVNHMHGRPSYMSFVSKATLWDRGLCNYTTHTTADQRPLLCPRFLSHVKTCSEDLKPPGFLRSKSRPLPPCQGKTQNTETVTTPKSQVLGCSIHLNADRRKGGMQNEGSITRRRSAVIIPCLPFPTMAPSSIIKPTPPQQSSPQPESGRQKHTTVPLIHTRLLPHLAPVENKEYQQEEACQPNLASLVNCIDPELECRLGSAGPEVLGSSASLSHGSLSDFSRPPSSLFSRSTDLASGRSSVWSDKSDEIMESSPLDIICFSPAESSPLLQIPVTPCPPGESHQFSTTITTTPVNKMFFGQTKPLLPHPPPPIHLHSDKPLSRSDNALQIGNPCQDPSADPGLSLVLDCDQDLATLTFPSTPWSSCSSPQLAVPCSVSPKLTSSPPISRMEAQRWPILPPISSVREVVAERCSTAASGYSELSCSQSHVFDELEAIAPRSTSCPSLDQPSDSSHCPSPDTDMSPGLAALTVGCDSGNLGSLSRVQLLMLNRQETDTILSPPSFEEDILSVEMWPDLKMQNDYSLNSAGVLRPLTAGSISERCDSTGKVQENKLEESEGGSPSSWIIDPSPSYNMFSSSDSPCHSSHGSNTGDEVSTEEESNYPGLEEGAKGRSHDGLQHPTDEKERRIEDRKIKALQMLSKLQDETPHQPNSRKGYCNFEDFDFLAKYCIFSQEKLAEYKRAFEEEDSDGDGYISCLQVLFALKNIVPPELLSEEEEIYVYRILEMVDLRVTDGLVDLRLFAVIASLAQKIATMDDFMHSLISSMDFCSLEVRVFKAKKLFLFLLEEQAGEAGMQQGFISAEQLLLELKAGGIYLEQEEAIRLELQHIPPLDLVDFLAYLPLFMLIHKSVIANPLDDSSNF